MICYICAFTCRSILQISSMEKPEMPTDRRRFLRHSTLAGMALGADLVSFSPADAQQSAAGKSAGLIVRSRRPLDLETPVDRLDSEITPNEWFFVRNHFGEPAVNVKGWSVTFDGLFSADKKLNLSEIFSRFERVERPAVAMCAGNGRALFKPTVPGLMWERGAVGQAVWGGIRLADLIGSIGLKAEAKHLIFETGDTPPTDKAPPYTRSLPLERLMQSDIILANRMNGEPLPLLHGGPLRLVVPTWTANHWVKWIRRITASATESPAFFQQTGYKFPTEKLPPEVAPKPEQLKSVTQLFVKSQITSHLSGASVPTGTVTVRGLAWTGAGTIAKVEIRTGADGPWQMAKITSKKLMEGAWVRWEATIDLPERGMYQVASRATDSGGNTQPDEAFWNRSGYLYNAIDPIKIQVG
jgi:DMSO/TMAO reductase YedYZ molybdopterin-dependent catalytic subunit